MVTKSNKAIIQPHVSIIILNWNKWADTIECLESVLKSDYKNYSIILIDNGSDNDSVEKILAWADGKLPKPYASKYNEIVLPEVKKPLNIHKIQIENGNYVPTKSGKNFLIHLILSNENLGFAKANNVGIRYADVIWNSKYYYLLNNDTVIENETLGNLVTVLENYPQYKIAQSTIYFYEKKEKIAIAGGKLFLWGKGRFYTRIKPNEIKEIGFINGCALLLSQEIVKKYGTLSERFFFGEEDFEYSLRLSLKKVKKVCVGNSRVYHKISLSSNHLLGNDRGRRLVLSALNRIADMRNFYPGYLWILWRYLTVIYYYLFLMIIKHRINIRLANKYLKYILKKSRNISSVNKTLYEEIISKKWN
ncbi:MAG: glycosyltransferase family 2 protein [Candidatus Marinimicrobia bacterium]|jgi:hypothetical protein|nr:glycosyltransferase family 2 protein [Candidatus Neomarinimicrobiota bacterium]MCK9559069.1 glycosyltransferase family 2 protein [Candidatus Neomarinimicrobiota bacterium]